MAMEVRFISESLFCSIDVFMDPYARTTVLFTAAFYGET